MKSCPRYRNAARLPAKRRSETARIKPRCLSENAIAFLPGLYHAGSVGIIMSGWLGTVNYGVITANKMAEYLHEAKAK